MIIEGVHFLILTGWRAWARWIAEMFANHPPVIDLRRVLIDASNRQEGR